MENNISVSLSGKPYHVADFPLLDTTTMRLTR